MIFPKEEVDQHNESLSSTTLSFVVSTALCWVLGILELRARRFLLACLKMVPQKDPKLYVNKVEILRSG